MPKTSVGKFDKKVLRVQFKDFKLPVSFKMSGFALAYEAGKSALSFVSAVALQSTFTVRPCPL
jgi:hypothetical protein